MMSSKGNYLRKSKTFLVQKNQSSSMGVESGGGRENNSNSDVNKIEQKAEARVELLPVSPQLMYGEEMVHFSHPRHRLSRMCLPDLFTCSGCKEYGAGNRFSCQQCDFQLHDFCAFSPPALKAHPFHSYHQLLFYSKPVKGGIMQSKCEICAKPIKGFSFRCGVCSFQMHPCCAMLSWEMKIPSMHPHTLKMVGATTISSTSSSTVQLVDHHQASCGECKKRRSGRVYRCTVCEYQVHAVCAKSVKNGLRDNGHNGAEKPSVLGTAARLASQVVVEFLGGIIEGLGEGVGEAFVQNINGKAAPSPLRHR
ncbi:uncharacterized protein LOC103493863 isoform X2 [Cucumis melo]|uniref:Uncharacterized protein LOC103493863 isoform X2 n=1 Tax=Cucumis melo TaxID=3656 RepID=A0A1S3BWE6_CUCME|nr:uncharacterized protein LOC103493863 isoform X2 [Cucumis melo]